MVCLHKKEIFHAVLNLEVLSQENFQWIVLMFLFVPVWDLDEKNGSVNLLKSEEQRIINPVLQGPESRRVFCPDNKEKQDPS